MDEHVCDQVLDITGETCPMTYVRTRLALDRLAPGKILAVRLRGAEPEANVPRNALMQGHGILGARRDADGITTVFVLRGAGQAPG